MTHKRDSGMLACGIVLIILGILTIVQQEISYLGAGYTKGAYAVFAGVVALVFGICIVAVYFRC